MANTNAPRTRCRRDTRCPRSTARPVRRTASMCWYPCRGTLRRRRSPRARTPKWRRQSRSTRRCKSLPSSRPVLGRRSQRTHRTADRGRLTRRGCRARCSDCLQRCRSSPSRSHCQSSSSARARRTHLRRALALRHPEASRRLAFLRPRRLEAHRRATSSRSPTASRHLARSRRLPRYPNRARSRPSARPHRPHQLPDGCRQASSTSNRRP
jgi:hypothetical protein